MASSDKIVPANSPLVIPSSCKPPEYSSPNIVSCLNSEGILDSDEVFKTIWHLENELREARAHREHISSILKGMAQGSTEDRKAAKDKTVTWLRKTLTASEAKTEYFNHENNELRKKLVTAKVRTALLTGGADAVEAYVKKLSGEKTQHKLRCRELEADLISRSQELEQSRQFCALMETFAKEWARRAVEAEGLATCAELRQDLSKDFNDSRLREKDEEMRRERERRKIKEAKLEKECCDRLKEKDEEIEALMSALKEKAQLFIGRGEQPVINKRPQKPAKRRAWDYDPEGSSSE